jgi:hypothetical protein
LPNFWDLGLNGYFDYFGEYLEGTLPKRCRWHALSLVRDCKTYPKGYQTICPGKSAPVSYMNIT